MLVTYPVASKRQTSVIILAVPRGYNDGWVVRSQFGNSLYKTTQTSLHLEDFK